jgi:hypothetical protein
MTKKHFEAIAEVLSKCRGNLTNDCSNSGSYLSAAYSLSVDIVAEKLADYFVTANPRFDKEKFLKAVNLV